MAPRGIRNNNPGNIEYGKFARSMGATGSDGRFAIFPDVASGIRAIAALQRSYENRGLLSPAARIGRWAPSGENNTSAYANSVAKGMGITAKTPFSFRDSNKADDAAFIKAMIGVENGRNPYGDAVIASAIGGGGSRASPGYPTALYAVNSYAPPAPKAMAYANPGITTAGAGASRTTHRPVTPMASSYSPPAAVRVAGGFGPIAPMTGSIAPIFPGSSISDLTLSPGSVSAGLGAAMPRKVAAPIAAAPIKARPLVTTPPVVRADPAATPTHSAFHPFGGLFANLLGIGNNGSHPGLFGGGGILGSLFGGSAGGGKGSPTGGPSGVGYTGLFTGSNPFIRGNATEPQMTTAQYQAMNPGPWSSPSSKKR